MAWLLRKVVCCRTSSRHYFQRKPQMVIYQNLLFSLKVFGIIVLPFSFSWETKSEGFKGRTVPRLLIGFDFLPYIILYTYSFFYLMFFRRVDSLFLISCNWSINHCQVIMNRIECYILLNCLPFKFSYHLTGKKFNLVFSWLRVFPTF